MATAHARSQTLGTPCSIQGVQLQAGTQVFLGLSNELVLCVLPAPQRIQDVPCADGLVHFHPTAELSEATLSRDHVERGVPLGAGTRLSWNEDGTLGAVLRSPHVIADIAMPPGSTVRFDQQGMLISWSMRVHEPQEIEGIACQADSIVTFHATGGVERISLAKNHTVGPVTGLAGTDLELHHGGQVAVVTLGQSWSCDGITFEVGTNLTFRPDGSLSVAILAEEHEGAGVVYPEGAQLYFDAEGRLSGFAPLTWEVLRPALS